MTTKASTKVAARHPDAAVVVLLLRRYAERHGRDHADAAGPSPAIDRGRGYTTWHTGSGCNWRALVRADVSSSKQVIGDELRSRTDRRRAAKVMIAANVLNQTLDLGRPEYAGTA